MKDIKLGFRDAIHVPFLVVTCDTDLEPGDKLSLRRGYHDDHTKAVKWPVDGEYENQTWHGVADPFVEETIPAGAPFRIMIRKECFSAMRHDFTIETHDHGGTGTCHSVCGIW